MTILRRLMTATAVACAMPVVSCAPQSDSANTASNSTEAETWTDTVVYVVGEPQDDTVLLLFGKPRYGKDAIRAIIVSTREDMRFLESDSATRSKHVNPDSVAASLRAEVARMEAELAAPPFTIAVADSLLALVQAGIVQIRDSGQASAYINGEPHTLDVLLKADSALREVITELQMSPDELTPAQ